VSVDECVTNMFYYKYVAQEICKRANWPSTAPYLTSCPTHSTLFDLSRTVYCSSYSLAMAAASAMARAIALLPCQELLPLSAILLTQPPSFLGVCLEDCLGAIALGRLTDDSQDDCVVPSSHLAKIIFQNKDDEGDSPPHPLPRDGRSTCVASLTSRAISWPSLQGYAILLCLNGSRIA